MNLLPSPLLAAADLQEIIFVIVFLVIGFLQWLFNLIKEKKEAAERARKAPSQAEIEARRRAWEEQTRQEEAGGPPPLPEGAPSPQRPQRPVAPPPAPPSAPPVPTTGGSLGDLMETLRRSIEEVSQPRPATPPPVRPPAPAPPKPARAVEEPKLARQRVLEEEAPAARPVARTSAPAFEHRPHPLTEFLKTTHGYQQAFVLREVLGPCKALEDERQFP